MKFLDVMRDERGFIHTIAIPWVIDKLAGGGGGGPSAGTVAREAEVAQFAALGLPFKPPGQSIGSYIRLLPVSLQGVARQFFGLSAAPGGNGGVPGGCADPRLEPTGPDGRCEFPGSPASGVGQLRKGKYGPAEEPMFVTKNIRFCLDGMILGDDKLCYPKKQITNSQRLWPKGTAPLLTGGQMKAIRVAAGAGAKLERTTKRLQKIGLMKKPAPRRAAPHLHAKAATGVISVPG